MKNRNIRHLIRDLFWDEAFQAILVFSMKGSLNQGQVFLGNQGTVCSCDPNKQDKVLLLGIENYDGLSSMKRMETLLSGICLPNSTWELRSSISLLNTF